MADGVVDRLVIATEFDESGLDRGTKAQLAHLERFVAQVGQISRSLPPITVDATQITTALAQAGGDLEAFARILAQLSPADFVAALDAMVLELGEAGGQFKATSVEAKTLQAAIDFLKTAQAQAVGATQAATTALTQEAGAARLTANTATDLAAALARTGVATRQLAAQGTQPIALNVQPAINAADTLISRMGLAQRSVNSVRQVLATPLPPIRPDPGVAILTAGYIAQTAAVQRLAAENLVAARSVDAVAAAMSRASTGSLAWAQGAAIIAAQNKSLAAGGAAAGKGIERVRAGLTGLALSASGTSPAVGQVVSGLLLLGGGSTVVLGVAAGIAAIAAAFNLIEGPTKRARKEVEDLIATLERARIGRLPGFEQVGLQLDEVRAKMESTGLRVEELRAVITRDQRLAGGAFRQGQLDKELDLLKKLKIEATDLQRVQQGLQVARGNDLVRSLAIQQATFGKTALEAQRLAVAMDDSLTPAQRRAATAILNNLVALDRQKQAAASAADEIKRSADEVLRAFRSTQSLAGLGDVLSLTADTSGITREIEEAERQLASLRSQGTRITISGEAEALLREISIVEARLAKLRARRGEVAVTGDASALTAEITKAEQELVGLREQAVNLRIDGDAAPVLRSIAVVEARLADLRTERAQITLTGDSRVLTDQIAEAESQLERLRAQGGVAVGIDGDAFALLAEITKVETRLVGLRGDRGAITLTGDTTRLTQQITEAEEQLARLRAEGVALSLTADPTEILRQITTVEDRLGQLRGQGKLIALAGDTDTGPLARQIADLDAALGRLRASGGAATDAFRQMQQQRTGLVEKQREAEQLVAAFLRIGQAPLELKFEATLDLRDPDKALADLLKELEKRADEKAFAVTLKALRAPVEIDTSLIGDAERVLEDFNTDLARQNPIWREANIQAAKMVKKLDDGRSNAQRLADTLADAFAIMDAFAGFGTATGILSEQDIRAFQTFQDAATSIGKFAAGDIVGGIVSALDTLGGIFGKSAMQQEHEAILRENSAAINRNTIAQNERLQGASGVALGQAAVAIAQANAAFRTLEGISLLGISTAALEEALQGTGLSLQELSAIARDNDIELLDSKGRLVAGALDQLDIALKQAEERLTHFGTSLEAQSARMATRDKLGLGPNAGLPEDVQALARTRDLQLSGLVLDPQLEARIAGLDLATEEGRQAFLEFNRMLFGMAERGELTAEQLDAFGNVDTLNLSLGTAADQINAFGETARDAANELSIIPKGFRQAALAFEAQIPGLTAPLPPRPPPPPPLPPSPPRAPTVDEAIPPGEAITADAALERLIPEPILITGAELLDRMVAFGAIPATTGLPAGVPSDGAALPLIAASLGSATAALAQIAASLAGTGTTAAQQESNAVLARLADFLNKAKIGQTIEQVLIPIDSDGKESRDVALEIRRALENISMADYGRTDRWGQT